MTEPNRTPPALIPPTHATRWSRAKMARFLAELAATHSVSAAARVVGMSRQSAYRLKARLRDDPFDLAWEAAVQSGYDALHQAALDRALNGVEVPVYHRGELVGTRRAFDERLTVCLLSSRNHHTVPLDGTSQAARLQWSGYFSDLLIKVRSGAALPRMADEREAAIEALADHMERELGEEPGDLPGAERGETA